MGKTKVFIGNIRKFEKLFFNFFKEMIYNILIMKMNFKILFSYPK